MSKHLPDNATLAFKGEMFDVYQWQQKMYDGTFSTFEQLKRQDTALIIPITEDKKIMIQEEEQPNKPLFLTFTAGKIEAGESPEIAAKRELLEETGYAPKELIPWYKVNPISKIDWTIHVFIAKGCKKVAEQNLENGEKISLKFISFEEFLNFVLDEEIINDRLKVKILEAKLDPTKMQDLKKLLLN